MNCWLVETPLARLIGGYFGCLDLKACSELVASLGWFVLVLLVLICTFVAVRIVESGGLVSRPCILTLATTYDLPLISMSI